MARKYIPLSALSRSASQGHSRISGHRTGAGVGLNLTSLGEAPREVCHLPPPTPATGPGPAPTPAAPAHVTRYPKLQFLQYNHCNNVDTEPRKTRRLIDPAHR